MFLKSFMKHSTVNPMDSVLKQAMGTLDKYQQDHIAKYWQQAFSHFQEVCDAYRTQRPGQGLYTTGALAVLNMCNYMRHTPDMDTMQAFEKLNDYIAENFNVFEALDTKVEMYWYAFAEEYRGVMPHSNNRVMEDFQHEVATAAQVEWMNNPGQDIRLTAFSAVQSATIAIARAHVNSTGICADMTRVSKIAAEQRAHMLDEFIAPMEAKDLVTVEDDLGPEVMLPDDEEIDVL